MESFSERKKCVFCYSELDFGVSQREAVSYYTHYCVKCRAYEDQAIEYLMPNRTIKHHRTVYFISKYRIVQYHQTNTTLIYKASKSEYQLNYIVKLPIILPVDVNNTAKTVDKIKTLLLFK